MIKVRRIYLEDDEILLIFHKGHRHLESLAVRAFFNKAESGGDSSQELPSIFVDPRPGSNLFVSGQEVPFE
jgi:hypothetical protein